MTLAVGGASALLLPNVAPTAQPPLPLRPPEPREERPGAHPLSAADAVDAVEDFPLTPYRVDHDPVTGVTSLTAIESSAWAVAERQYSIWKRVAHRVHPDDPAHAGFEGEGQYEVLLPGRTVTARASIRVEADVQHFHFWIRREIAENGGVVREREWNGAIPRDFQ